jgi:hypothetical protein
MVGYAISAYPHACLKGKSFIEGVMQSILAGHGEKAHVPPGRDHLAEKGDASVPVAGRPY